MNLGSNKATVGLISILTVVLLTGITLIVLISQNALRPEATSTIEHVFDGMTIVAGLLCTSFRELKTRLRAQERRHARRKKRLAAQQKKRTAIKRPKSLSYASPRRSSERTRPSSGDTL